MNLRQMWRIVTRRETPMERARRAIKGARRYSKWLGKRPLTDGSDEDMTVSSIGTGY